MFASRMREGPLAASAAAGLEGMKELIEVEVAHVVGAKDRHEKEARTAYRHGREMGAVVLEARKIPVQHPRGAPGADRRWR